MHIKMEIYKVPHEDSENNFFFFWKIDFFFKKCTFFSFAD